MKPPGKPGIAIYFSSKTTKKDPLNAVNQESCFLSSAKATKKDTCSFPPGASARETPKKSVGDVWLVNLNLSWEGSLTTMAIAYS